MQYIYKVLDQDFRADVTQSEYPFKSGTLFKNSLKMTIRNDMFIDIILYATDDNKQMPYHLHSLTSPDFRQLQVTFTDNKGTIIGQALLPSDNDKAVILTENQIQCGSIVYNPEVTAALAADLNKSTSYILPGEGELLLGRTGYFPADKMYNLRYKDHIINNITHDDTISTENDQYTMIPSDSDVKDKRPVMAINGKTFKTHDVIITAHPDSEIRILTSNDGITFATKGDLSDG